MSYKIRVSSRAIIIKDNAILLNDFGGGQYYNFIGGGIEEGETAKQAVQREVLEEAGLAIEVGEHVFSLEYEPLSCNNLYGDSHHVSFFFRCSVNEEITKEPTLPDANPNNPSITSIARWIPIDQLDRINLVPKIQKELIQYIKTGVFYPSFWAEDEHR